MEALVRSWLGLTDYVLLASAAATALEQNRGYYVAISSVGAQVRNPGTSDANMSKHAVNRLIEFIVLGPFHSILCHSTTPDRCAAQSIPACARLRSRLGS